MSERISLPHNQIDPYPLITREKRAENLESPDEMLHYLNRVIDEIKEIKTRPGKNNDHNLLLQAAVFLRSDIRADNQRLDNNKLAEHRDSLSRLRPWVAKELLGAVKLQQGNVSRAEHGNIQPKEKVVATPHIVPPSHEVAPKQPYRDSTQLTRDEVGQAHENNLADLKQKALAIRDETLEKLAETSSPEAEALKKRIIEIIRESEAKADYSLARLQIAMERAKSPAWRDLSREMSVREAHQEILQAKIDVPQHVPPERVEIPDAPIEERDDKPPIMKFITRLMLLGMGLFSAYMTPSSVRVPEKEPAAASGPAVPGPRNIAAAPKKPEISFRVLNKGSAPELTIDVAAQPDKKKKDAAKSFEIFNPMVTKNGTWLVDFLQHFDSKVDPVVARYIGKVFDDFLESRPGAYVTPYVGEVTDTTIPKGSRLDLVKFLTENETAIRNRVNNARLVKVNKAEVNEFLEKLFAAIRE